MAESVTGAHRLLSRPQIYKLLQVMVGSNASHRRFVDEHVRPAPGERILDIGCGPGHFLHALPASIRYVGFDASADYIAAARRTWGDRAEFHCMDVRDADLPAASFDVVLVMGLLHHLDNAACGALFALVARVLTAHGRLIAIEPAHASNAGFVARWLIGRDRGEHVRTGEAYADLARSWFRSLTVISRTDLLRVPYVHAILQCAAPAPPTQMSTGTAAARGRQL